MLLPRGLRNDGATSSDIHCIAVANISMSYYNCDCCVTGYLTPKIIWYYQQPLKLFSDNMLRQSAHGWVNYQCGCCYFLPSLRSFSHLQSIIALRQVSNYIVW